MECRRKGKHRVGTVGELSKLCAGRLFDVHLVDGKAEGSSVETVDVCYFINNIEPIRYT